MQSQKIRVWALSCAFVLGGQACGESKDEPDDRGSPRDGPEAPEGDAGGDSAADDDAGEGSDIDAGLTPDDDASQAPGADASQPLDGGASGTAADSASATPDVERPPDDGSQLPDDGVGTAPDAGPLFVGSTSRDLNVTPRSVLRDLTLDECLRSCASERSFACLSVDFDGATQICELNDRAPAAAADFSSSPARDHFAVGATSSALSAPNECGPNTVRDELLCYPICRAGFSGEGPVCWENCPPDRIDDGATCRKDAVILAKTSQGRGVGVPMVCGANEEQDGALCYPRCNGGYNGVGPVCWQSCPSDYHDDGATCRKDAVIVGKESRGRGVGQPMICAANEEQNGALCYPRCASGYSGVGPVCWQSCPGGYQDDGVTCRRDAHIFGKDSYGRGAGYPLWDCNGRQQQGALCYDWCRAGYSGAGPVCWQNCPEGYQDDGGTCRRDAHIIGKASYGRGAGAPLHACASGQAPDAGLCYPACPAGFSGVGPVCWAACPAGFQDDGATCRKDAHIFGKASYGRGVGAPLHACANGEAPDAGLCYQACAAGFRGVGPVCWSICPAGFQDDGATCRKDVEITGKQSYGRGAGYLRRDDYRGIFTRYIRDHYNLYIPSASPLTSSEKTFLYQWFPARLVDAVKVVELEGMTGTFSHSARATTYGANLIAIRRGDRSNGVLKHELVHACQYDHFGIDMFGQMYADQWVDGGYSYEGIEFEKDAFAFESQAAGSLIDSYAGKSGARSDWYSGCK